MVAGATAAARGVWDPRVTTPRRDAMTGSYVYLLPRISWVLLNPQPLPPRYFVAFVGR